MTGGDAGRVVMILGSMILIGSALIARRGRWRGRGLPMALAWVAILAAMILIGRGIDGRG